MRYPIAFILSGAVLASALSLPALADQGHGLFERSDTDGDGFVTKLEFNNGRAAMFTAIDANADGFLDQAELQKARDAWRQKMGKPAQPDTTGQDSSQAQAQPAKERHGFMKRIDTNEDGRISGDEFAAAGERRFAKLDVNGDGKLIKEEMPRHRKHGQETPPAPTTPTP